MFRSIALFTISLLLTFSILAPSITILLDDKAKTILVMDFNEEEKKKVKKCLDEEDIFYTFDELTNLLLKQEINNNNFYMLVYTDYSLEILLPPPEYII